MGIDSLEWEDQGGSRRIGVRWKQCPGYREQVTTTLMGWEIGFPASNLPYQRVRFLGGPACGVWGCALGNDIGGEGAADGRCARWFGKSKMRWLFLDKGGGRGGCRCVWSKRTPYLLLEWKHTMHTTHADAMGRGKGGDLLDGRYERDR